MNNEIPFSPSNRSVPEELIELAMHAGDDPTLIQGAGGNISLKSNDVLWIKASGQWLSAARKMAIFTALSLPGVRKRIAVGDSDPANPEVLPFSPPELRPSIETSLHALLPHRLVAHVHSVNAIALSVRPDAEKECEKRLRDLNWAWVPYVRPGVDLTQAVSRVVREQAPDVLILANHGLVVGGADRQAVEDLLREVEARLVAPKIATGRRPDLDALHAAASGTPYLPAPQATFHAMAIDPAQCTIARGGSMYPDHVVFLGPGAVVVDPGKSVSDLLRSRERSGLEPPPLVLVSGAGVLLHDSVSAGALAMIDCLAMVLARVSPGEPICYLSGEETAALLDWDAEKYRRCLS